jgi:hypothetical protein
MAGRASTTGRPSLTSPPDHPHHVARNCATEFLPTSRRARRLGRP